MVLKFGKLRLRLQWPVVVERDWYEELSKQAWPTKFTFTGSRLLTVSEDGAYGVAPDARRDERG